MGITRQFTRTNYSGPLPPVAAFIKPTDRRRGPELDSDLDRIITVLNTMTDVTIPALVTSGNSKAVTLRHSVFFSGVPTVAHWIGSVPPVYRTAPFYPDKGLPALIIPQMTIPQTGVLAKLKAVALTSHALTDVTVIGAYVSSSYENLVGLVLPNPVTIGQVYESTALAPLYHFTGTQTPEDQSVWILPLFSGGHKDIMVWVEFGEAIQ